LDLGTGSHATEAVNTLRCVPEERGRGVIHPVMSEIGARHPNLTDAALLRNRLQFTVAVFLAKGAVLGMIRQEEFNDRLAGTAHAIAAGLDLHPFCNRVDARCDQVTTPLHFNDAYPTGSRGMIHL
jgi:hypothetical protein